MGTRTSSNNHPGLYKRGRYWWLTKDPLEGRPKSTRCTSLLAAREYQIERERLGANPAYAAAQGARLGEWCSRFVSAKERSGTKPVTLGYLRQKLGHWVRIFGQDAPLAMFGEVATWDTYAALRIEERGENTPSVRHTVSKECKVFRQVLKSAQRAGCFPALNIADLHPEGLTTSYVPRSRALTIEEMGALLRQLENKPKLRALVALSISTAARLSEAQGIAPSDVDLAAGVIWIRGTKTEGSNRMIPILRAFRGVLEEALPHLPLGRANNIVRDLKVACRQAGIAPVTPNDLRRSNATILAELGAEKGHLKGLFGHTTEKMLDKVYARPRAMVLGQLIERSIGVVEITSDGRVSREGETSKPLKDNAADATSDGTSGFLSRRSAVQIGPGALEAEFPSAHCSVGVAARSIQGNFPATVWALALIAERFGLERRAA